MTTPLFLSVAEEFCSGMLPKVSRTFALSIEALPISLRAAVRTAYLLCRIVDTIEDDPGLPFDERLSHFDLFQRLLENDDLAAGGLERVADSLREDPACIELCRNAGLVFNAFRALSAPQREAIRPSVLEMATGMRQYALRKQQRPAAMICDLTDLERYCYYVAGTVGHLLTALFQQQVPSLPAAIQDRLHNQAERFGIGLQLVNIVKDVAEDLGRGFVFIPEKLAQAFEVPISQLLSPDYRQRALRLLRVICGRARECLAYAEEYTLQWPLPHGQPMRLFCAVPLMLALATLNEVEHGTEALLAGKSPTVSREVVMRVVAQAADATASETALGPLIRSFKHGAAEALPASAVG